MHGTLSAWWPPPVIEGVTRLRASVARVSSINALPGRRAVEEVANPTSMQPLGRDAVHGRSTLAMPGETIRDAAKVKATKRHRHICCNATRFPGLAEPQSHKSLRIVPRSISVQSPRLSS